VQDAEDLSKARCFHHAAREAVARCPRCRRCFCRECITEHQGKVLCAACLREITRSAARKRSPLASMAKVACGLGGLLAAWIFIELLGRWLLAIPSSFHEGALWAK
jgi:hypothetical protein